MKASDDAFQDCSDPVAWPFAEIARQAAALHPDLVIHVGDIHYRESPCPAGRTGCAGSPWGYGYDAWKADFFQPARPLLAAAPWVYVRGNHESCWRAGQGWFRFIAAEPWSANRSCDDPGNDAAADFTAPYAVPLDPATQLIVFDSSRAAGKPLTESDAAWTRYRADLAAVDALAARPQSSLFLSHHPLLALAPGAPGSEPRAGGNRALLSVFASIHPERLFAPGVELAMHGHVHLFEALTFSTRHPGTLVLGNSGSANEGAAPQRVSAGFEPFPGARLQEFAARSDFGFAMLERDADRAWTLTEYSAGGRALMRCGIRGSAIHCKSL